MIHQKSNYSKQQKRYVPPCFRQEQEVVIREIKEEEINQNDSEQVENFPQLSNPSINNSFRSQLLASSS